MQLFGLSIHDLGVEDQKSTFALVLKVGDFFLNEVLLTRDKRLGERDLLFSVKKHHRVESRDTWNIEVTISEWTSMTDSHCVGWEGLETFSVFICELEVVSIHSIGLESNTESIENCIVVLQLNLIRFLFVAECFFDIYYGLFVDHGLLKLGLKLIKLWTPHH